MATYIETKREAIGFELPPADPFAEDSDFIVPLTMGPMQSKGHIVNYAKFKIEEQAKLKAVLEVKWDAEYEADQKAAKKNMAELNNLLFSGDAIQLEKLFAKKPAADWLNIIFFEESELNELINKFKTVSSECQAVVVAAIEKELNRLVNFKTLFEIILEEV